MRTCFKMQFLLIIVITKLAANTLWLNWTEGKNPTSLLKYSPIFPTSKDWSSLCSFLWLPLWVLRNHWFIKKTLRQKVCYCMSVLVWHTGVKASGLSRPSLAVMVKRWQQVANPNCKPTSQKSTGNVTDFMLKKKKRKKDNTLTDNTAEAIIELMTAAQLWSINICILSFFFCDGSIIHQWWQMKSSTPRWTKVSCDLTIIKNPQQVADSTEKQSFPKCHMAGHFTSHDFLLAWKLNLKVV